MKICYIHLRFKQKAEQRTEFYENAYFMKFYNCVFYDLALAIYRLLPITVLLKALFVSKDNDKVKKLEK